MFERTSIHRHVSRRPFRLELTELERRDQPARLSLSLSSRLLDGLPEVFQPASVRSANISIVASSALTSGARAAALVENVSITEILGSTFTELIVTITPAMASTPAAAPEAPSSATGNSGATPSALTSAASATPFAAPPAQEVTPTGLGTGLRGLTAVTGGTTPFVIVSESPATVRGGGPTNDTVALRATGPTTAVLGPPTATNLSAGGLGGVVVVEEGAATNTPAAISPSTGGRTSSPTATPATPPATVQSGTSTGGDDAQQGDEARPVAVVTGGETWLERYGSRAALAALGAAAGGYGVIRWRRSRMVKTANV